MAKKGTKAGRAAAKVRKPARMTRGKGTKARAVTTKAAKKVSAIPRGFRTVTPHLVCRGTSDALAFYKKAFGAKEMVRMAGPDGHIAHAEMRIGDSMIMLGDEMPQMGASAPQTIGGTPVHIFLYVPNVDKLHAQAIAAGATNEMAPMDMFWGDRYAKLVDPFGHKWSIATHIEDLSPKEMTRRGQAEMAKMAAQAQPGAPAA